MYIITCNYIHRLYSNEELKICIQNKELLQINKDKKNKKQRLPNRIMGKISKKTFHKRSYLNSH